jgi:succinoglycan biosynthesis protein ExoM
MTATRSKRIDICVCTFRRPHLADTLRSLAALDIPGGYTTSILVADNDDEPSARQVVTELVHELNRPARYIHCPARNISLARNACLDASRADFIAFIDDDEIATPQWLRHLIETLEQDGCDIVLGPVRAHYRPDAPRWMKEGDFHSTFPVWVSGEIRTGYTCNVLLRSSARTVAGRRFSLARGRTGGEDTQFFEEVTRAGGRISYAPQAWVEEAVPPVRASFGWLARRRFRVGQTHGRLLRDRHSGLGVAAQVALAMAKAAYCFAGVLPAFVRPVARNRALLRGIMHAGAVSGLIGVNELRQYGTAPPRERPRHAA